MALWFTGVCDQMLMRVKRWLAAYDVGEVYATRPFLHTDGRLEDIPTIRLVYVAWQPAEVDHLVRILEQTKPDWHVTLDLTKIRDNLSRCPMSSGGVRITPLAFYKKDVQTLVLYLEQVRDGITDSPLDTQLDKKRSEGKGLWE